MPRLTDVLPDENILLALNPAELAPFVLEVASSQRQNGLIHLTGLFHGVYKGDVHALGNPNTYNPGVSQKVELAVAEAWSWLAANQLLVPDPGANGYNGYMRLSRRAEAMKGPGDFKSFIAASSFPKSLLHPLIADDVWLRLARGEYDIAVFTAFRAVEEQVRKAGGYLPTDVGTELMRVAFNADNGKLAKMTDPLPERQALAHLFAGAIGSYKNPHSHRTVTIADPAEVQEIVVLASHLLRIVDARRP